MGLGGSLLVGVLEACWWGHVRTALGSAVVERRADGALAEGLLGLHAWLHLSHAWLHWRHSVAWHHSAWWHLRGLLGRLTTASLDRVVTLHVSRHLVIADLLLKLDKLIVQLGVELVSLSEHVGQLVLRVDSVIDLREESLLGRVSLVLLDQLAESRAVLGNDLGDVLSLLLELIIVREVVSILLFVGGEDLIFCSVVLHNLQELFDTVELLVHLDTLVHDLVLLEAYFIKLVESILSGHNDWVLAKVNAGSGGRDHGRQISTGLVKQVKVGLVSLVVLGDLYIDVGSLAHLHLVVLDLLAVGSVNSSAGDNLTKIVGLSHLSILCLFFIDGLLDGLEHIFVDFDEALVGLGGGSEVLSRALLLEIFDLGPQLVWNLGSRGQTLDRHGQVHLLQESIQLVVALLNFIELLGDDTLQNVLQLILHLTHCWGHQVSEQVVDGWLSVDFGGDIHHLHEVVRVGSGALISLHDSVVVDTLVLLAHSDAELAAFVVNLLEVGRILAAKSISEGKGLLELSSGKLHHTDSFAAALAFLVGKLALSLTELVKGHSEVVLGVVAEHVGEMSILESAKLGVNLVVLESLREVDGDLGADLGQNSFLHVVVTSLAEEQVLGLSEAQVRAHAERLLGEVSSGLTGGQLNHAGLKVLENPSGLLEQVASFLGSVTGQIHVASLSHAGNTKVVQRRVHLQQRQRGLLLLLGEAIVPDELKIDIALKGKMNLLSACLKDTLP